MNSTDTVFTNEEDRMDAFFSTSLNKFCIMFNGKLFTFKTHKAYIKKKAYFINKYKLTGVNED